MNTAHDAASDLAARTQAPTRNVYRFTIPDKVRALSVCGTKSIGLVKLTAEEEVQATERAGGNQARTGYQLAKASLCEVDGAAVSLADNSVDRALERMDPLVRQLTVTAYMNLHQPKEDVVEGFLETMEVVNSR